MKIQTFFKIVLITAIFGFLCLVAASNQTQAHFVPPPVCDEGLHIGNPHCDQDTTPTLTPVPTDEVSPTVTPEETPTATPEATVTQTPGIGGAGDGLSDGRSDGRSDGLCSKPPCHVVPQGAPATGRAAE